MNECVCACAFCFFFKLNPNISKRARDYLLLGISFFTCLASCCHHQMCRWFDFTACTWLVNSCALLFVRFLCSLIWLEIVFDNVRRVNAVVSFCNAKRILSCVHQTNHYRYDKISELNYRKNHDTCMMYVHFFYVRVCVWFEKFCYSLVINWSWNRANNNDESLAIFRRGRKDRIRRVCYSVKVQWTKLQV